MLTELNLQPAAKANQSCNEDSSNILEGGSVKDVSFIGRAHDNGSMIL